MFTTVSSMGAEEGGGAATRGRDHIHRAIPRCSTTLATTAIASLLGDLGASTERI